MLELSRLRAGVLPLARERVDLASVVGRAVEELRPQAEEGALTLTRERVGERFDARGDEDRLGQGVLKPLAKARPVPPPRGPGTRPPLRPGPGARDSGEGPR